MVHWKPESSVESFFPSVIGYLKLLWNAFADAEGNNCGVFRNNLSLKYWSKKWNRRNTGRASRDTAVFVIGLLPFIYRKYPTQILGGYWRDSKQENCLNPLKSSSSDWSRSDSLHTAHKQLTENSLNCMGQEKSTYSQDFSMDPQSRENVHSIISSSKWYIYFS